MPLGMVGRLLISHASPTQDRDLLKNSEYGDDFTFWISNLIVHLTQDLLTSETMWVNPLTAAPLPRHTHTHTHCWLHFSRGQQSPQLRRTCPVGNPDHEPPAFLPRSHLLYHTEEDKLTFLCFLLWGNTKYIHTYIYAYMCMSLCIYMAHRLLVYMNTCIHISVLCTVNVYAISMSLGPKESKDRECLEDLGTREWAGSWGLKHTPCCSHICAGSLHADDHGVVIRHRTPPLPQILCEYVGPHFPGHPSVEVS